MGVMGVCSVGGGVLKAWKQGQAEISADIEIRAIVVKLEMPRMTSATEVSSLLLCGTHI
jgi:hypothetical protein